MKECAANHSTYTKRDGSKIEYRQVFGQVVQRLLKFKAIGDSVAAIDPTHLAVPWAAISLVLQVTVKDFESNQTLCEGIEIFSGLVPRYALFERLYLRPTFPLQDALQQALVKLYATALKYLLKAQEYYTTKTISLILAYDEFDGWMDEIREQQRIADESARLIDARANRDSDDTLDSIKREQDSLIEGLQYFHEPIQFIRDGVVERERDEQECRILNWLIRLPLDGVHRHRLEARLPDSGHWIFEEENYKQWRVSSKSALLWLHGPPGSGKSTMMSTIIGSLQANHAHAPGGPLAYAFFSRNDSDRRWQDPVTLVCCLIAQLARSGPSALLRGEVIRAYETMVQERGEIAVADGARPAWNDAIRLLLELIDSGTTTICIDAIDECAEDLRGDFFDLIDCLLTRTDGGRVKIIISSRPSLNILGRFPLWPSDSIDVGQNSADLRAYARNRAAECVKRMRQRAHPVPDNWEETSTQQLIEGSQGMFLWVKLRASTLLLQSDSTIFEGDLLLQPSSDLPEALIRLFETIYARIIASSPQGSITRQAVFTLFRWLLCAQAPIPAEDLIRALAVLIAKDRIASNTQGTNITVPMVLESCQDLVVVDQDSNEIRFVHTSIRDFLKLKDGMQSVEQHAAVAHLCLATVQNLAIEPPTTSLPRDKFHYYVVLYWALHVEQAGQEHQIQTIHDAFDDLCHEQPWFKSWLPEIQPASSLILEWNDPHKDKIIQAISSPATSFFTACAFGFTKVVRYCIQSNSNLIHHANDMGATGLHLASEYGHEEIAEALCKAGADVNSTDTDGETPLIRAAAGGYKVLVLMLLDKESNIRAQGQRYGTALHGAALHGHLDVVEILLDRGADINVTGGQFGTALHAACLRGQVKIVKRLLDAGADINAPGGAKNEAQDKTTAGPTSAASFFIAAKHVLENRRVAKGRTPRASKRREAEQIFQLSLDRNVDINILTGGFGPPLHIAARAGHEEVIDLLLRRPGISVNCQGGEYGTALQAAAVAGRTIIVQRLLDAKADPNMQAGKYGTALIAACRQENFGLADLLLQSGAEVNIQAGVYGTALHAACRSGNMLLVQRLLHAGADVKLTGGDYHTALQAASRDGFVDIVHVLLQRGVDVNVQGGTFESALRAATVGGHHRVVEMLCAAEAKMDKCLELACLGGHQAVAEVLLAHGSDLMGPSYGYHTPLQAAMAGRHHSLARWLLEKGAKATDSKGIWGTNLQLAALAGEAELVGIFLGHGADPWEENDILEESVIEKFGVTLPIWEYTYPIVIAAAGGHSQVVTLLLESDGHDRSDGWDNARSCVKSALRDALHVALETGQQAVVDLLLSYDVPVDRATVKHACSVSNPNVVISLLEMRDRDTSEQDGYDNSICALYEAALHGKIELVELLLPRAIQSNHFVPTDLAQALQNAVSSENLEIVHKLLHYGASATIQSDCLIQSHLVDPSLTLPTPSAAVVDEHREIVQTPLDRKGNINIHREEYGKALQTAAYDGAEDLVTLLLNSGVNVNDEGGKYGTAVQAAAAGGHETIVQRLISAGANLRSQGGHQKRYKTIKKRFETEPIRKQCGLHGTALQAAAISGNVNIVAMLVQAGADINDIDSLGETPLHHAVYYNHLPVVKFLINKGADVEGIDSEGHSPVLLAALMGHLDILAYLFSSATESITNSAVMKKRSLHLASQNGRIGIIEHLIAEQIDLEVQDETGQTALFLASSTGQCSTVRFLIDNGSKIHHRAHNLCIALHMAAKSGHDDVVRLLLTSGADMLAVDNRGWSALHYAAARGHSKVVYLLIERGMSPNLQDYVGKTALHHAVSSQNTETVTILLNNGANTKAKSNDGKTPIELPRRPGEDGVRDLLIRHEAATPNEREQPVDSPSTDYDASRRSSVVHDMSMRGSVAPTRSGRSSAASARSSGSSTASSTCSRGSRCSTSSARSGSSATTYASRARDTKYVDQGEDATIKIMMGVHMATIETMMGVHMGMMKMVMLMMMLILLVLAVMFTTLGMIIMR
ncbi:uncharacterized protein N7487_008573 [Penicillium crustosum]|uniref:uncharacterized protein n=1 Tax=Penicillium crustosum TaxID=36656 RepID=UPI0023948DB2|nr:uncharacterized protein N7487_008573 [Penicillium crustosum]KAJ5402677.1 hypothetical protein N7487_008573 [Penicillium crustosum]